MLPLDETGFERVADRASAWSKTDKIDAFTRFQKLTLPSSKEEVWRYVDLDFTLDDFGVPDTPGAPIGTDDVLAEALGDVAASVHVVDGTTVAVDAGPLDGATVAGLAGASGEAADLSARHLGTLVPADLDIFAAAHRAFGTDGVLVHVPAGLTLDRPIYLDVQTATDGSASFPHILVVLERSAEATVVINYRSAAGVRALVVPQLEMVVADDARLRGAVVQNWSYETNAIAQARATVAQDASLRLAEVGLGGHLSRFHLGVDLVGKGSSAEIHGGYFGDRDQTLDYRYFMHHVGTNTNSNMFLKGAVEDEALSVFTGMIRIEEGAQRTDAFQTNRNLILSKGAAAESVPNLEILANDVRCGHGSTVGPLDEEQRYYLMSRGLPRPRADRLQVRGFFEDAIERFPVKAIAEPVRRWVNGKFIAAQEEGRLS